MTKVQPAAEHRRDKLDEIAARYHLNKEVVDHFIEELHQTHSFSWVEKHLKGGRKILEMGYGDGRVSEALIALGHRSTILEGSQDLVDQAKKRFQSKADVICTYFENFEAPKKFDRVIATFILEHVDDPVRVLRQAKSWLKPGGKIIILVPNAESLHRRLAVLMGVQKKIDDLSARDHLVGHQRVYTLGSLEADLKRAGFKISEKKGFFLKPLPNSMMLEFPKELLLAMNRISSELPPELMANIGIVATRPRT